MKISKIRTTTYTMNLLDKITHFKVSGLAIALIPFFFACNDPTELGLELESNENPIKAEKVEFILPSSSIYIDSLRTDASSLSVFGQYEDSVFGLVKAISFNEYNLNGGVIPEGDSLEYSSVFLTLSIDNAKSPGTLSGENIKVHKTLDTLYNQPIYLSSRETLYENESIGELSFDYQLNSDSINPRKTVIRIPLHDDFGLFMYDKLDKAKVVGAYRDSLFNGLYHYPPLALVPGDINKGLFHFDLADDTTRLSIEMRSKNTGRLFTFDFDFIDSHYSQLIRDRSSAKLSDLTDNYDESSVESSLVYLNNLAGIYPKINMNPFHEFIKENNNFIVNRATLSFGVQRLPSLDFIDYTTSINAYFIKLYGKINSSGAQLGNGFNNVLISESSYASSLINAPPLNISFDEENLEYKANVTLFCQVLADYFNANIKPFTEELVLVDPNQISLSQASFNKGDIKLTIYYTTIKD